MEITEEMKKEYVELMDNILLSNRDNSIKGVFNDEYNLEFAIRKYFAEKEIKGGVDSLVGENEFPKVWLNGKLVEKKTSWKDNPMKAVATKPTLSRTQMKKQKRAAKANHGRQNEDLWTVVSPVMKTLLTKETEVSEKLQETLARVNQSRSKDIQAEWVGNLSGVQKVELMAGASVGKTEGLSKLCAGK